MTRQSSQQVSSAKSPGKSLVWVACTRSYAQDLRSQLDRRREAAARSVPLDCGCRDPLCRCTEPPLTEHVLDGWAAAARHILSAGQMPVVPLSVRRALWRRPADRDLAETLHNGCGGEAA